MKTNDDEEEEHERKKMGITRPCLDGGVTRLQKNCFPPGWGRSNPLQGYPLAVLLVAI